MPWFVFYGLAVGFAFGAFLAKTIGISTQAIIEDLLRNWQYLCIIQLALVLVLSLSQALT